MVPFITFEGTEGSGKTTQIQQLAQQLRQQGYQVLQTREPGGCQIADQIRGILLHPDNSAMVSRAELLLYAAARAQHVEEIVQPALTAGKILGLSSTVSMWRRIRTQKHRNSLTDPIINSRG